MDRLNCDEIASPWLLGYLRIWRDWMHSHGARLGYPRKSAGFVSGGVSGEDAFAELCDAADHASAPILDALIDALPPLGRVAVYQAWGVGASCWRMRDPEQALRDAYSELERKARAVLA